VTGRLAPVICALMLSACAIRDARPTAPPPAADAVVEIRVTSIPPAIAMSRTVSDPEKIRSVAGSGAVSAGGWWQARGRELLPLYRIDLVVKDGGVATYWLGTNSYPARFPCFAICTGWWLAPSTTDGQMDTTKFRGMTSATYLSFLANLGFYER
jgi:hypothetical protein